MDEYEQAAGCSLAGALKAGESTLQNSLIISQSKDAGKETPHGQAFVAAALAPNDVALDGLEEVGAMAVDKAAEEEGNIQEEGIAGDNAAEEAAMGCCHCCTG